MNLPELRSLLDGLGIRLTATPDGKLRVDAPAGMIDHLDLRAELVVHKAGLLASLVGADVPLDRLASGPSCPGAPADDYDREERAAIMEFDGGLTREEAERRAGIVGI